MAVYRRYDRPDGTTIEVAITDVLDGDFHIDAPQPGLDARRAAVMPGEWSVVRQVHGARVVRAPHPDATVPEADALIVADAGRPVAVQSADCAPIALVTSAGAIGVVHAGWRGLRAGVIGRVVDALADDGASVERAIVGPLIGPECYEFDSPDLDFLVERFGSQLRATTATGTPALDLAAGVYAALTEAEVAAIEFVGDCTACGGGFSHRARGDTARHAVVARIVDEVT